VGEERELPRILRIFPGRTIFMKDFGVLKAF